MSEVYISDIVKHIIMLGDNAEGVDNEVRKYSFLYDISQPQGAHSITQVRIVPIAYVNVAQKVVAEAEEAECVQYGVLHAESLTLGTISLPHVAQKVVCGNRFMRAGPQC